MQQVEVETYPAYLDYLEVHPEEFGALFNTILINVTSFFRDRAAWDYLDQEVLAPLLEAKDPSAPIRVWSAGVASGEEAYTVAILLAERLGLLEFQRRVKIYATDIDEEALALARQATYGERETVPLGDLRDRYLTRVNGRYEVIKEVRRSVIFGRHDLLQDAPISRTDLLICRNTLMYFNADVQERILARFHFSLVEHGTLFLGKAETLLAQSRAFQPVNLKYRVFRKVPLTTGDRPFSPSYSGVDAPSVAAAPQPSLRDLAFEHGAVPEVIVDNTGTLIEANRGARALFHLPDNARGRPLRDLEVSYRPVELRSLIDQAAGSRREVSLKGVAFPQPDKQPRWLDVVVLPLYVGEGFTGVRIVFFDVTVHRETAEALDESKRQLEHAMEELQSSNEELETTNEELQSTVEELETTNEELQSTNEELETVNDELRDRSDELNELNAFLASILASLRMGVVVVNRDLNILAWNDGAEELWGVRPEEAIGIHILNLDIGYPVDQLRAPLRACLQSSDEEVVSVQQSVNRRGRPIHVRVTCTALRGNNESVEGVILLMEEADG